MKKNMLKVVFVSAIVLSLLLLFAMTAMAASSTSMPWESPMEKILTSITGPVAKFCAVIAIVSAGLGFAFSEGGNWLHKVLGIVLGLACAFGATTFLLPLLGYSGGVIF